MSRTGIASVKAAMRLSAMMVMLGAVAGLASAAEPPSKDTCANFRAPPEQRIVDCTATIKRGGNKAALAEAYGQRGVAQYMAKKYDLAIADETKAIGLKASSAEEIAGMYSIRALAEEELGRVDAAMGDLSEAIKLDPKNAEAWSSRCIYRGKQGTALQPAIADCSEAIRLDPDETNNYQMRAILEIKLSNFPAAVADCSAALKREPNAARLLYLRGVAKRGAGDASGAAADLGAAKAKEPDIADDFTKWGIPKL